MQAVNQTTERMDHVGEHACIGIVTVSDRASQGEYQDEGGPAILAFLEEAIASPCTVHYRCVPDERETIGETLIEMIDELGCDVVVTTGGTGPAQRDVTPEAIGFFGCHVSLRDPSRLTLSCAIVSAFQRRNFVLYRQ